MLVLWQSEALARATATQNLKDSMDMFTSYGHIKNDFSLNVSL